MWFKNLRIYRLTKSIDLSTDTLEEALDRYSYQPCGNMDFSRYGWVYPLGHHGSIYTHGCNGQVIICARKQEKILPPAAINEMVSEKILELETNQGRNIYRKEKYTIKEDVIHSLLPRALTRSTLVYAYFAPQQNLLVIDAPSVSKAEEFLDHLRLTLGSLPIVPISCHGDASEVMTRWLQGRTEKGFELERECELRNPLESNNIVRCRNQELESDEILSHLKAGKRVIQLALNWRQSISFMLNEDFAIRRVRFEDSIQEEASSDHDDDFASRFDQDFAVMTLQLNQLIADLVQAFGGMDTKN